MHALFLFFFFFFLSCRLERFEETALVFVAFYFVASVHTFCIEIYWVLLELAVVRPTDTPNSGTICFCKKIQRLMECEVRKWMLLRWDFVYLEEKLRKMHSTER